MPGRGERLQEQRRRPNGTRHEHISAAPPNWPSEVAGELCVESPFAEAHSGPRNVGTTDAECSAPVVDTEIWNVPGVSPVAMTTASGAVHVASAGAPAQL